MNLKCSASGYHYAASVVLHVIGIVGRLIYETADNVDNDRVTEPYAFAAAVDDAVADQVGNVAAVTPRATRARREERRTK